MFCGECGTQNADTRNFCLNCGKTLRRNQPSPGSEEPKAAASLMPQQPATGTVMPVQPVKDTVAGSQAATSPPVSQKPGGSPLQPAVPAPAKPPLNKGLLGLGIIGIIIGIASWFLFPYLLGILAIVTGVIAIAKSENRTGAVAVVAGLAILIGVSCIVVDLFYFTIFPVPKPVF